MKLQTILKFLKNLEVGKFDKYNDILLLDNPNQICIYNNLDDRIIIKTHRNNKMLPFSEFSFFEYHRGVRIPRLFKGSDFECEWKIGLFNPFTMQLQSLVDVFRISSDAYAYIDFEFNKHTIDKLQLEKLYRITIRALINDTMREKYSYDRFLELLSYGAFGMNLDDKEHDIYLVEVEFKDKTKKSLKDILEGDYASRN